MIREGQYGPQLLSQYFVAQLKLFIASSFFLGNCMATTACQGNYMEQMQLLENIHNCNKKHASSGHQLHQISVTKSGDTNQGLNCI